MATIASSWLVCLSVPASSHNERKAIKVILKQYIGTKQSDFRKHWLNFNSSLNTKTKSNYGDQSRSAKTTLNQFNLEHFKLTALNFFQYTQRSASRMVKLLIGWKKEKSGARSLHQSPSTAIASLKLSKNEVSSRLRWRKKIKPNSLGLSYSKNVK